MKVESRALEVLSLSTLIGIIAIFAAPWVELRGTYAAWRIVATMIAIWRKRNAA